MAMVATDGHRLAHIEKAHEEFPDVSDMRTLVPKKAMAELNSLLGTTDVDAIDFADDESTLFFRIGERVLTTRQLTGQFPNFEAVLPRDNNKFVIVRTEDICSAIQRVAQFADERSGAIKLRLDKGGDHRIVVFGRDGRVGGQIETPYAADPVVIGFNSQYLIDFLKAATGGKFGSSSRMRNPPGRFVRKRMATRSSSTGTSSCRCGSETGSAFEFQAGATPGFFHSWNNRASRAKLLSLKAQLPLTFLLWMSNLPCINSGGSYERL